MANIDVLKPAILSVVKIVNSTEGALKDGFQPFADIVTIMPSLMAIPGFKEQWPQIVEQGTDLDSAEIEEISSSVVSELAFGSDAAKAAVGKVLVIIGHAIGLYKVIAELRSIVSHNTLPPAE